jgi:hypothetical protein
MIRASPDTKIFLTISSLSLFEVDCPSHHMGCRKRNQYHYTDFAYKDQSHNMMVDQEWYLWSKVVTESLDQAIFFWLVSILLH